MRAVLEHLISRGVDADLGFVVEKIFSMLNGGVDGIAVAWVCR